MEHFSSKTEVGVEEVLNIVFLLYVALRYFLV